MPTRRPKYTVLTEDDAIRDMQYRDAESARMAGIMAAQAEKQADRELRKEALDRQRAHDEAAQRRWETEQEFEKRKHEETYGLSKRQYDDAALLRAEQLREARLKNAAIETPSGIQVMKKNPLTGAKVVADFFKDFQWDDPDAEQAYRRNPTAVNQAIVDGWAQGQSIGEIATGIPGVAVKQAKTRWWQKQSDQPEVDTFRTINVERPAGLMQQAAPAPTVTTPQSAPSSEPDKELQDAYAIISEYKRRSKENPAWKDSLPDAALDRIEDALGVINSRKQGGVMATSPQPVNTQPSPTAGRIVSDSDIMQGVVDQNKDGRITKEDADAKYEDYIGLVKALESNKDAMANISPKALKEYNIAKLWIQRYEAAMKKGLDQTFANVR